MLKIRALSTVAAILTLFFSKNCFAGDENIYSICDIGSNTILNVPFVVRAYYVSDPYHGAFLKDKSCPGVSIQIDSDDSQIDSPTRMQFYRDVQNRVDLRARNPAYFITTRAKMTMAEDGSGDVALVIVEYVDFKYTPGGGRQQNRKMGTRTLY